MGLKPGGRGRALSVRSVNHCGDTDVHLPISSKGLVRCDVDTVTTPMSNFGGNSRLDWKHAETALRAGCSVAFTARGVF